MSFCSNLQVPAEKDQFAVDLMDASLRSPASNIVCLRRRKERFENNAESMDAGGGQRRNITGRFDAELVLRLGCGRTGFPNQNRVRANGSDWLKSSRWPNPQEVDV